MKENLVRTKTFYTYEAAINLYEWERWAYHGKQGL